MHIRSPPMAKNQYGQYLLRLAAEGLGPWEGI
jgi:hypothetical protein